MNLKKNILTLIIISFMFGIYMFTSEGETPYNYYVKLSQAFINGKYYLDQNPPWLNELVPIGENRFAVVYPPAPALILTPLVFLFTDKFPQQLIAHILGALFSLIIAKIAYIKTKNMISSLWFLLLAGFGNIIWYLASNGSVWYLGQVSGAFFLTATIYESISKKRPFWISLFWGMAILSRLQIFLSFPLIIYLNRKILKNLKHSIKFFIPLICLAIFFLIYNHLRFGSFFETGYSLIPEVLKEPWYSKGIFHYSYIPNNLKAMFLSLPIVKNTFPYIIPSWGGLAIWITTPAFIYVFNINNWNKEKTATLISIILMSLLIFSHGSTGFTQFGYRFAVDFYPLIFYLMILNFKKIKIKKHHWFLLILSILVNLWGVVWINKFGWVSF